MEKSLNPEFPLQQGDLDSLCSLYAALNYLHVSRLLHTIEEAHRIFIEVVDEFRRNRAGGANLVGFVNQGIDPDNDQMGWLLSAVTEIAGIRGEWRNSVEHAEPACVRKVVFLKGNDFSHYTVIEEAPKDGVFLLSDSYGFGLLVKVDGQDYQLCANSRFAEYRETGLELCKSWWLQQ